MLIVTHPKRLENKCRLDDVSSFFLTLRGLQAIPGLLFALNL